MVKAIPSILAQIVDQKRQSLPRPTAALKARAESSVSQRRDFHLALSSQQVAIIAEIKKASPSKGILAEIFDPPSIARSYARGGAAALSVLTEEKRFLGSLGDLVAARDAVSIPVLRKDFTIDPVHVEEAAAYGADAILLIAAILPEHSLRDLRELAESYKMSALVEVHDREELALAVSSGARIIGVNNRDLHTFEVKLETSLDLADAIPAEALKVAESGIHTGDDIARLRSAGYSAFLVGEHLMKSGDPAQALQALLS